VEVDWVDDADSRVDIAATARADLKGLWHLRRRLARDEGRPPEAPGAGADSRPRRPGCRTVAAEVANVAAFGSLWIAQYVILDKVLFRPELLSEA